jgi:hypothetical protein
MGCADSLRGSRHQCRHASARVEFGACCGCLRRAGSTRGARGASVCGRGGAPSAGAGSAGARRIAARVAAPNAHAGGVCDSCGCVRGVVCRARRAGGAPRAARRLAAVDSALFGRIGAPRCAADWQGGQGRGRGHRRCCAAPGAAPRCGQAQFGRGANEACAFEARSGSRFSCRNDAKQHGDVRSRFDSIADNNRHLTRRMRNSFERSANDVCTRRATEHASVENGGHSAATTPAGE